MNFFSQLVFPEQHKTDANRILNKKINKKNKINSRILALYMVILRSKAMKFD